MLLVEVFLLLEIVLSLILEALFFSFLVDDGVRHAESFQAVGTQTFLLQLFSVQLSSEDIILAVPSTNVG